MIVEGCDILLDVNQVFVRQGMGVVNNAYNKGEHREINKENNPAN